MVKTAIIEDSKAIAGLYRTFLEGTDFQVICFGSSESEIDRLIDENGFDVIICPSYPKFQSGLDILARIKGDSGLSSALFVISTTMQKGDLKSEWDFRDIRGIIVKPFQKEDLIQSMTNLLHSIRPASRDHSLALVVDDSPAVQKILAHSLRSLNFDVITASDGEQGLALALEHIPNLILTDVEMPVMDGFELCRRISMEPTISTIPLVVISGRIDDSQFRKAFNAGAIDFLQKPVSHASLVSVVEAVAARDVTFPSGTALISSSDATLHSIFVKVFNSLNFHINFCTTDDELEIYLGVSIPNIIIIDLVEHKEKLAYCQHVRNLTRKTSPVIIVLVDEGDRNTMVQCFSYGATEFISKPFGREELKARIENHIKIKKLQEELLQKNRILESLAYRDKLTGLMNRRYFDEALGKELIRTEKEGLNLSFMMMDLDNFKQVNDQYGHDIGDVVLQEISRILMNTVDDSGIVCRYGGEEFCVIFPEKTLAEAMKIGEEVRRSCVAITISRHKIRQSISAGIASCPETSSVKSLVIDADNFLYKAKQAGKNRVFSGAGQQAGNTDTA